VFRRRCLVVGPEQVLAEVAFEVSPHTMDVVRLVLGVVVFDQEARRLIEESYKRAIELLTENRKRLDTIVVQLLERETLDETEVYAAAGLAHARGGEPEPEPRSEQPISVSA